MTRSITLVPGRRAAEENHDLLYSERISRNRSLHLLLQDCSPHRTPSRRQFLLKSYREIIQRYLTVGRLEHPVAMLRGLIGFLEKLSMRIDCRVDDFDGLGVYVLLQDANTYYLLMGRGGIARVRGRDGDFVSLGGEATGVQELPVQSANAQKELFSQTLRDFLVLYRVDGPASADQNLHILLGGAPEEAGTVARALEELAPAEGSAAVPVDLLSHTAVCLQFPFTERTRIAAPAPPPGRSLRLPRGGGAVLGTVAAIVVVASLGTVWITDVLNGDDKPPAEVRAISRDSEQASASSERSEAVEVRESPDAMQRNVAAVEDAPAARARRVARLTELWKQRHSQAVTSSPAAGGGLVFYGARDRSLQALDALSGEARWRFEAEDGIGSSAVIAGQVIVAADYLGNVYCLESATGKELWRAAIGARVVSTPAAGQEEVVVAGMDGQVHCLSLETGRTLWKYATGGRVRASLARAGQLFLVPSYDGNLYALSRSGGVVEWKYVVGGQPVSSPAADAEIVLVGSPQGTLAGLNPNDGKVLWLFDAGAPLKSPVRLSRGRAYFGAADDAVRCVDTSSGELIWRTVVGGTVHSRPVVTGDHVLVTSYDQSVYCLDAGTGKKLSTFRADGAIYSSPVVQEDRVFFGTNNGTFYCLRYLEKRTS